MDFERTTTAGGIIATSHKRIPSQFRNRNFSLSTLGIRNAVEHIPCLDVGRLRWEKYIFLSILLSANILLVYMSTDMSKYFWLLLPLHALRPLIDSIEIVTILIAYPIRRANLRRPQVPKTLENLVYLLPCYNETSMELVNSLNSLAEQNHLDAHKKAIVIVCDGRCKGKGMTKTTAEYLTEDIIERPSSTLIREAYRSWDGSRVDVEVLQGKYQGLPVFCIIKAENRGKRDGIILIRSFLQKFNQRNTKPSIGIMSARLFAQASEFLTKSSMTSVEYVVGMDADTRFDTDCVFNLMQTVREGDQVVGVSGYVQADPKTSKSFSIPYLFQNAEYTIGQYRRRLRQDLTSRKVTCLPGCCQLLRVIESTCGDDVLGQFGYHPTDKDGLFRTIRSMMSEDRDHVCLVLRENANVEVRQCLNARAYTSVPQSFLVFLCQRRRWTLGPITSDVLLIVSNTTGWVERLSAMASTIDWGVTTAMFTSRWLEEFDPKVEMFFFALGTFRYIWDLSIVFLSPRSLKEAIHYIIGTLMCHFLGPYVGMTVVLYSLYHLDDFRWGRTRTVSGDGGKRK
ncbi:chitin synthase [Rhexocercosporidium sp. MPI-PUGE-AT-0058]|nr:chitin synthase [Rhexocercosporidium sp. MPI-PUGE-AT-0058]